MVGMVYLVGAGPGDYRLISVKACEYLKIADTVVYDRLADDRLLSLARRDAEMIYVGKASSNHTMRQEDINQLLVDKAKAGKVVVRLKGGDPFVFGRGGEEALLLQQNNLPFEIVPGITSAIAVAAYAGIPVTHRAVATSFAVVTGHEDPSKGDSNMRWDKLATGTDTLVFLMGVENLPHITAKLIENGRAATTPAAVIRWGTKPEQRVLTTTVGSAAADVKKAGLRPPAIFIVGDVVKLREQLAWFDNRPLFGKKILVTRSRSQASALTNALEALGAQCVEAPAIKVIDPPSYAELDARLDKLATYDWLIFTSVNGVEHFFKRLRGKHLDSRALGNIKVAAIGVATAAALEQRGIYADVIPAEFRAEGVIEAMRPLVTAGTRILLPRAQEARAILPEQLTAMGAIVDVAVAYQTVVADTDGASLAKQLKAGEISVVTFTSSSTVKNLLALLGDDSKALLANTKVACIGPITGKTCLDNGIKVEIMAEEYTISGLTVAIEEYFR